MILAQRQLLTLRAVHLLRRSSPKLTSLCHLHTPRNLLNLDERGLIHDIFPKEAGHDIAHHLYQDEVVEWLSPQLGIPLAD